jgi:hypothetical protein
LCNASQNVSVNTIFLAEHLRGHNYSGEPNPTPTRRVSLNALIALSVIAGLALSAVATGSALRNANSISATPVNWVGPLVRLSPSDVSTIPVGVPSKALAGSTNLKVDVGLRPSDPSALTEFVNDVSNPDSPDYRHYLAPGQFAGRFGASSSTVARVESWLASRGLRGANVDSDDLSVSATGSVSRIESAFGTDIRVASADAKAEIEPTSAPLVPSALAPEIDGVFGISGVRPVAPVVSVNSKNPGLSSAKAAVKPQVVGTQNAGVGPQPCSIATAATSRYGSYTANQIANAYSMDADYAQGRDGTGVSVALVESEPYSPSDVAEFQSCYGTHVSVTAKNVDGGPGSAGGKDVIEADLDIEEVAELAPGASIHVYQGPYYSSPQWTWASWTDTFQRIADDDTSKVVSTSWVVCENGMGSLASFENIIFEQMGAQGQTVLAASGDYGSEACGYGGINSEADALTVEDPASQPYVTGVGGTALTKPSDPPTETLWSDGPVATGGGLSKMWSIPSWQDIPAVTEHLPAISGLSDSCDNSAGTATDCREVPDVSSDADFHSSIIFAGGGWAAIAGTSEAAPMWAAVIAIVDQGCAAGVGFLNPTLYALGAKGPRSSDYPFNIVTPGGDNDVSGFFRGKYFQSTPGYNMTTGWGSPDVAKLVPDLQRDGACPAVTGLSPSIGPTAGGTSVSISGSQLSGVTSVRFGTVSARSFAYNGSNRTLTAIAPPSSSDAGVYVTVTASGGTSVGQPDGGVYRYTGPSTSAVSPAGGPASGRNAVTIEGSDFTGADAVMFGTKKAEIASVSANSVVVVAPPGVNGTATPVTVTTPIGTSPVFAESQYDYTTGPIVRSLGPSTGPTTGGTQVIIRGGNLSQTTGVFFGAERAVSFTILSPVTIVAVSPGVIGGAGSVGVSVESNSGSSPRWGVSAYAYMVPATGYSLATSTGTVLGYGSSVDRGSLASAKLGRARVVSIVDGADDDGYWLAGSNGAVFAFRKAGFYGSMAGKELEAPIVNMARTPDGKGYWLVASDGGIFSFGDARFYGSMGAKRLNKPIVGLAATPDGKGYWLVASDGGIFSFGDARFYGSMGGKKLASAIVGIAETLDGAGYWMVGTDGGVFSFGDAVYHGSRKGENEGVAVGIQAAPSGGYFVATSEGAIHSYDASNVGDATYDGTNFIGVAAAT